MPTEKYLLMLRGVRLGLNTIVDSLNLKGGEYDSLVSEVLELEQTIGARIGADMLMDIEVKGEE